MVIKKDLSALPTINPDEPQVVPGVSVFPTKEPVVGQHLAAAWFKARTHDDALPRALPKAGPFRGSDAAKCTRALWYKRKGVKESNPSTIADHWRMDLGTMVHTGLQDVYAELFPDAINELKLDLNTINIPGSMHMDILNPVGESAWEAVEIKTVNGYGFKVMATTFRGDPEGPRNGHMVQMALGAAAAKASGYNVVGGRIVYLSLELLSPDMAKSVGMGGEESRFLAEWYFPIDQLEAIAAAEQRRLLAIPDLDAEFFPGQLPGALGTDATLTVRNPATGAAVDINGVGVKAWFCNYCPYQEQCKRDYNQANS